jgi:hypothetical protein
MGVVATMEMRPMLFKEMGSSQGWGSKKKEKDFRIFVDTIYLEQI